MMMMRKVIPRSKHEVQNRPSEERINDIVRAVLSINMSGIHIRNIQHIHPGGSFRTLSINIRHGGKVSFTSIIEEVVCERGAE